MADIRINVSYLDPIPPALIRFTYGRGKGAVQKPFVFTRSWAQTRLLPSGVPHCQLGDRQTLLSAALPWLQPETGARLTIVAMWLSDQPSFSELLDMASLGLLAAEMNVEVEYYLSGSDIPLPLTPGGFAILCLDVAKMAVPDEVLLGQAARDLIETL